jgi:hypothetical protein
VIAAVEGTSRWVVIAFALVVVFAYLRWGRKTESALAGRLAWIRAASQVLVILLAVLALFVGLFVPPPWPSSRRLHWCCSSSSEDGDDVQNARALASV